MLIISIWFKQVALQFKYPGSYDKNLSESPHGDRINEYRW